MRIQYLTQRFRQDSLDVIAKANAICAEYKRQGYDLTLRQVYYQFVARGFLANSDRNYKRLGGILNDARLAGEFDWDYIEDRTRFLRSTDGWMQHPSQAMEAMAAAFKRQLWVETDQHYRPEVWVEKDALVGIVEAACRDFRVPHLSCRGYVSQSEMFQAGRRMRMHFQRRHEPVVIHLGDHDPSGIDMTRDIQERLSMFAEQEVRVERIALNMDQIEQYQPPPNPAKLTDSRGSAYVDLYGSESWELDALEPTVLVDLIQGALTEFVNPETWQEGEDREETDRARMTEIATRWDDLDDRWNEVLDLLDS